MPTEMWLRIQVSPVPAHTMLGLDGATASEPMDDTGWSSKMGLQVVPASSDLKIPPDAEPA